MSIILNGTTGITTPDVTSDGSLKIDASAPDDSLVVNASGNVGIGKSSPTYMLDVARSSGTTRARFSTGSAASDQSSLEIKTGSADYVWYSVGNRNDLRLYDENAAADRLVVDSSGNLLVGTTDTLATTGGGLVIHKYGGGTGRINSYTEDNSSNYRLRFYNAAGGTAGYIITATDGSSTSYATSSDYRLKEDWQPMANASDRVLALKPINFAWKASGERVDGFLAHEVAEVVPEAVSGEKDAVDDEGNPEYQGIDQSKLVPLLTAALQEALAEINDLKARVSALEAANV